MIGCRSASRGDARSSKHVREMCEWRDASYGHRGVRVGEASHSGPPLLRRLRSGRSRGVPVEILSDEEPLVRHVQSPG